MKESTPSRQVSRLVIMSLPLLFATSLSAQARDGGTPAGLTAVAAITMQFEQADRKLIEDAESLFGHYLGTGKGSMSGALHGSIGWDLYEDQTRDDLHPAHFRGVIEQDGDRHDFQIIGVFTPDSDETVTTPDGREHPRIWTLSGTIVFENSKLLGTRHAVVTGSTDLGVGQGLHRIWLEQGGTP